MTRPFSRLFARLRAIDLNAPRTVFIARALVPILFGLYSVWLGADTNSDLFNYHLYNPFAWLHGRLLTDIAPATSQTYFNPMLDVAFSWMLEHLPPRLIGFLMGALHGLSFLLLLGIARHAVPGTPNEDSRRVPLLLAAAGVLSASLLTGLGNSTGDDTTALFCLMSLFILVSKWDQLGSGVTGVALLVASGALVGIGNGLKLTTACYSLAMCIALLSHPSHVLARIRLSFIFGLGVLLGFGISEGYWAFHMWQTFGNPFYPQFSQIFPSPMTQPIERIDARWLPHDALENLLWPFVFTLNPRRLGEVPVRNLIWPIVYLLFWYWLCTAMVPRLARRDHAPLDSRARFLILYVSIGYVIWMRMFSIYRYLVAIEVLMPIIVFALATRLWGYQPGRRIAVWLIGMATALTLIGGVKSWGHEGWSDPLYHAEVPAIPQPKHTTVLLYSIMHAWAWLATQFPADVVFIGFGFPGTPLYYDRLHQLVKSRGDQTYAVFDAVPDNSDWRKENVAKANRVVSSLGLTQSKRGCAILGLAVQIFHLHARLDSTTSDAAQCRLDVREDDAINAETRRREIAAENHALIEKAVVFFKKFDFTVDVESCKPYKAWLGTGLLGYQWCHIKFQK